MVDDIKLPNKGKFTDVEEIQDEISEPDFVPPEQIVDDGIIDMAVERGTSQTNSNNQDKKSNLKKQSKIKDTIIDIKKWWKNHSKRQKALFIFIGIVVLCLLSFGGYKLYKKLTFVAPPPVVQKVEEALPPPPTTEPSKLTGVEIPIELNKL